MGDGNNSSHTLAANYFRPAIMPQPRGKQIPRGRPRALSPRQLGDLTDDLRQTPRAFGYHSDLWSGKLLARHLAERYGVELSARRCRWLLDKLEWPRAVNVSHLLCNPAVNRRPAETAPESAPRARPLSKDIALRRIRRLAVSGLPLEPFVQTLFEIVGAALPLADNQTLLADPRPPYTGYVYSNPAMAQAAALNRRLVIESGPELSGVRDFNSPEMLTKTVWMHREIALPHLYRSPGYNEVQRPLGMHHCMIVMLVEDGQLVGRWPMWRSEGMPDWHREEAHFMCAAASYITHGLQVARDARPGFPFDEFVAARPTDQGMVLLDSRGRVRGADRTAETIFSELRLLDDPARATARERDIRGSLGYIGAVIRKALDLQCATWDISFPSVRMWSHQSGIVLRLRGVALDADDGGESLAVLVERGELETHRRQRVMLCCGMSPREYEILRVLSTTAPRGRELAAAVGMTQGTLKTHLKRIAEKLEVDKYADVRRLAAEILAPEPMIPRS
jgi:DNA-binding CsgD family transcriptional regulator